MRYRPNQTQLTCRQTYRRLLTESIRLRQTDPTQVFDHWMSKVEPARKALRRAEAQAHRERSPESVRRYARQTYQSRKDKILAKQRSYRAKLPQTVGPVRPWTPEEDRLVADRGALSWVELAVQLGRSLAAVHARRAVLTRRGVEIADGGLRSVLDPVEASHG